MGADQSHVKHAPTAHHYEVGSSVSSVELLLDARTAAEGAAPHATRKLVGATGVDGPLNVAKAVPGPPAAADARRFAIEARSGQLGALFIGNPLINVLADLIMGGRGIAGDGAPSELELTLTLDRMLPAVSILIDAVQPGRPEAVTLIERDYGTPARSIVIEGSLHHQGVDHPMVLEALAHHVIDDHHEVDTGRMSAICDEVSLPVSFRYDTIHLHTTDVARLEPGDVICLEHDLDAPVTGSVGGRPLFRGATGAVGRRAAVEVVDLIEETS
ncbi:MAG: FliM/FliN family flagellar motor switch protein [Actinomycetota bacterium]